MNDETPQYGVVFPLPPNLIARIFDQKRTVFAKFFSHQNGKIKLGVGSIIFFYQSRGLKSLIGEARIDRIASMSKDDALKRYGKKLFLGSNELREYVQKFPGREKKNMAIFELGLCRRYNHPIEWPYAVTMTGRYITKDEFERLSERNHS